MDYMIQDILPYYMDNQYKECHPQNQDKVIGFFGREIFLKFMDKKIEFLTYKELSDICRKQNKELKKGCYLFEIKKENGESEKFFLFDLSDIDNDKDLAERGFKYHKMFATRSMSPKKYVYACSTAWHLYSWYKANQYCGACGQKLIHDKNERMLKCPECGNMVFPKIAPAIIVGVSNGDKLLMTKYSDREYKRYALIAGFNEIGETAEETVRREVIEETGIKIKDITYYGSQPWGYDSNLLLGYFAKLDGADTIKMDEHELSLAEWVDYHDIPDDVEKLTITERMMQSFKEKCQKMHGE